MGAIEEHVECLDLELEVLLPVRVAHPLAKADCVEQPRSGRVLAVRIDRDFRHLPVFVRPLRVADVPDLPVALAVLSVGKREERRILLVEEVLGRARIPVRHRAEVLRHHQPAVEGVLLQPAPQLAPVLEAPEQRTVVVSRSRAGESLRGIGVFAHVGERPLEQVVLPDTEHQHVEAALERPVDLTLPVPGSPVLGLEAREAAVREVAYAAVLEVRLLVDVEAGEVDGFALRHDVAVPEPVASATTFEKVVEPVPHAAQIRACNRDILAGRGLWTRRIGGARTPRPTSFRHNAIRIPAALRHLGIDCKLDTPLRGVLSGYLPEVLREFLSLKFK